jgi:hypothetical protein
MKFECAKADLDFIAAREQFLAAQASGDRHWIKRATVALAHADKRRAVAAVLSRRWSTDPTGTPQSAYLAKQPAGANDNPEKSAARDASRSAALARGAKQRQPKPETHSLSPGMTRMRRPPSVGRSGGDRGPFKSAK